MKSTTARPKSASINSIGHKVMNTYGQLNNENILKTFPPEILTKAWNSLSNYITQNYQSGKGTIIKGFGTFTFTSAEVNLEGTTNQFSRDHKMRKPVFIISKEFHENLRPGQFNPNSGLIYYNQKQSNSVSHIKFNYSELSYSLNISKEDCYFIIQTLIKYIAESIRKGEFKNKEMPGVGILMLRGNIIGVKFYQSLIEDSKMIPQKLMHTKRNMHLYMQPEDNKQIAIKDLPNVKEAMNAIRPKTSVITTITKDGERWLKENLDVDLKALDNQAMFEEEKIEGDQGVNIERNLEFINDSTPTYSKNKKTKFEGEKEIERERTSTLSSINIPNEILVAIAYHKSVIISEMKNFDKKNKGTITKIECVRSFTKGNVHYGLTIDVINSIIKKYCGNLDNIDYMKLMTCLLRDIKKTLGPMSVTARSFTSKPTTKSPQLRDMSLSLGGASLPQSTNFQSQSKSVNEIQSEINTIKLILNNIKFKYRITINQNISIDELIKIFRDYSIVYSKSKIEKILKFIHIGNLNSFTLQEFYDKMNNCKILSSDIPKSDTFEVLTKLKDIIYVSGGKNFLFPNNAQSISLENFLNLLLGKTKFSKESLENLYYYITKSSRDLTLNDYNKFFIDDNRPMDESFDIMAIESINKIIQRAQLKSNEYFSHLLSYNVSRSSKIITRIDFHRICLIEKLKFSAQEIDHIFDLIDSKKDGVIDRDEFNKCVNKIYKPLYEIQDIIKKNKLDIEDLAFKMDIDTNVNEILDYEGFKEKIKKLDYTYSDSYIKGLFIEMAKGEEFIETDEILKQFDVFKKYNVNNNNSESFKKKFIDNIKSVVDYSNLKKSFEYIDSNNNGRITKADFCSVIEKYSNAFKDDDIMKFTRITRLIDENNQVKYPEFLLIIYYNAKSDLFTQCIEELKKYLTSDCNKNLAVFFQKINNMENRSLNDIKKTITIEQMFSFLNPRVKNLNRNVVCKFDLDSDGLISYHDIEGIFERYLSTSFFKFENTMDTPDTNLYAEETMSEEKFKTIVMKILKSIKKININEEGLFNKLDINRDGFISNYEFNSKIDQFITLSPAIKDQFFNYLDYYHNGLVDLNTFLNRFKPYKSKDVLVSNNNTNENEIISAISTWLNNNISTLSDNEIFSLMDKDSDGIISLNDLKQFCINCLGFASGDLNDFKLQRVIQSISITKNNNIGFADVKEMINKTCYRGEYIDFKDKFNETINQNLYKNKQNTDWINDIITKFAMYISERYPSVEAFFNENVVANSGKFTFDDFQRFHRKNYDCFEGFNLTNDEILAVYTTLDSQKKNYLTLGDFQNKLKIFDFYKKMHFDVKNFIQQNFPNSIDAFKFFINDANHNRELQKNSLDKVYITKKSFFDTIQKFFPSKYLTDTILKYMDKNFTNPSSISFSEFNYVYFDSVKADNTFNTQMNKQLILTSNRKRPNSANVPKSRVTNAKLQTPFDYDPLIKLKRLLITSKNDYISLFNSYKKNSANGYINQYEFRNMIKAINIGMTHLEIEEIMSKVGFTRDGMVNINEFINYMIGKDKTINSSNENIIKFINEIKLFIIKYYSTVKIAFQFNDVNKTNHLDFNAYKSMVCELYSKENLPQPNFTQLKNSFDYIDLRKDGIIDQSEWNKAFNESDRSQTNKVNKSLSGWENSNQMQKIYNEIVRCRKQLKSLAKPFLISDGTGTSLIQCDNLINILKEVLPRTKLNRTQWKMIALMGDKDRSGMIDFNLFLTLVEQSEKHARY